MPEKKSTSTSSTSVADKGPGGSQLGRANYRAEQDRDAVVIFAFGVHPTPGYVDFFEQSPIDIFPPEFIFRTIPPGGIVQQVLTPFSIWVMFGASEPIKSVTVYDADGPHQVPVDQLSKEQAAARERATWVTGNVVREGSDAFARATTMAVGEEGSGPTTMAVGEEDISGPTTMAVGEEGPGPTTMATGEEEARAATTLAFGEEEPPMTTLALGEENPPTTLRFGEEGPTPTTLALGEEGPGPTTKAIGEEGPLPTTQALGEEGPGPTTMFAGEEQASIATTLAMGEEEPPMTTLALGEENPTTRAIGEEGPTPTTLALGEENPGPFGTF